MVRNGGVQGRKWEEPWLVWLSGLSAGLGTKGRQLDSQSGHMPGLQTSPQEGACQRQPHIDVSLPLSPSLLLSLKIINKIFKKQRKWEEMSKKWLLLSTLPVCCTPTLLHISATPPTSTRAGVSDPSVSFLPMVQLICMFSAPGGYKKCTLGPLGVWK